MRVVLIGADNEENLGLGMIAASLGAARHQIHIVPFTDYCELGGAVNATLRHRPQVVGLGMQFQHRGWEFVELAAKLRAAGFAGHLTAGGQFATMACEPLLRDTPSIDSVVLFDGEETIVDLVNALRDGRAIAEVPGLAVRLDDGCVRRTCARQLPQDLDRLPSPLRYRAATRHFGVPFVPISGGRGCWGQCAFCSITSYFREARRSAGGLGLRLRSPEVIAREMALRTHAEQSACIFCFHDETLLLPRAADTMARITKLTLELDRLGVEDYAFIGKCRPDCLTPELARDLAEQHVVRLYVGIENASQTGQDHLNRRTRTEQLDRALAAVNAAGIFACYNLLVFEPETTLDDVRENIAFIRNHPDNPLNFCRAEPYHGTPLWHRLRASDKLEGSWLGWDYHLQDPKAELLSRITSVVFRQRNFDPVGIANRSMSLGYLARILKHFHNGNPARVARFGARAKELTRQVSIDTADFFEQCVELVERLGTTNRERVERETVRLGMRLAERDGELHMFMDQFVTDAEQYAAEQQSVERRMPLPARLYEALTGLALAGCVATVHPGCGGEADSNDQGPLAGGAGLANGGSSSGGRQITGDALPATGGRLVNPSGGMVYDALPMTGGRSTGGSGVGGMVDDPLPTTGGRSMGGSSGYSGADTVPFTGGRATGGSATGGRTATGGVGVGGMVYDALPITGGRTATGGAGVGGMVYDALPITGGRTATGGAGGADTVPQTGGRAAGGTLASNEVQTGHFRDTQTRRTIRTRDLPLYDPPEASLRAVRDGESIRVSVFGVTEPANTLWESEGDTQGEGLDVLWVPKNMDDQLRVAIRTHGGVTIAAIRAKDVMG